MMFGQLLTAAAGETDTMTLLLGTFGPIVLMFVVFYFMLIRPEKKRKKQQQEMRDSIGVGSTITTIGGMVGTVVAMSGDTITFETGEDRVRIEIQKWGVSTVGKKNAGEQK